jgi:isopentenyl diphosphate isomerase/L-lactate dehydrogenase-like FMN-dependent dehydrogenase
LFFYRIFTSQKKNKKIMKGYKGFDKNLKCIDYQYEIGIGNGAGCLTTQQTGVGYPMASLIQECYRIKKGAGLKAKIVADGGFKIYSDVIKALALCSDYVMLGGILNRSLESV